MNEPNCDTEPQNGQSRHAFVFSRSKGRAFLPFIQLTKLPLYVVHS